MARWDLTDDEVEAVLDGAAVGGVPPGLTDLVHQLRHAPLAAPAVPPSPALAEFVPVTGLTPIFDLTPIPEESTIMTKLSRRLATTTGRVLVVAAVVLGSAGAAQARGVVDVRQLAGHGPAASVASATPGEHQGPGADGNDRRSDGSHQDGDADHRAGDADDQAGAPGTRQSDGNGEGNGHDPSPGPAPVPCEKAAAASDAAAGSGATDLCHRPPVTIPDPGPTTRPVPRPTIPAPTFTLPTIPGPSFTICERPVFTVGPITNAKTDSPVKIVPCPTIKPLPTITLPPTADGAGSGGGSTTSHSPTTLSATGPAATR